MRKLPVRLGRKVGRYKGKLFRSLYEYSFYKHAEAWGVDISEIDHEPLMVPYVIRKKKRNYYPDFLIRSLSALIEIKCERELGKRRGSLIRKAKFDAARSFAREQGWTFVVMTERNFKIFSKKQAKSDPGVRWIKG